MCEPDITTCRPVHKAACSCNSKPRSVCICMGVFASHIHVHKCYPFKLQIPNLFVLLCFLFAFIFSKMLSYISQCRGPVYMWLVLCLSPIMGRKEPTIVPHRGSYSITDTDSPVNDDSRFVPGSLPIMHQFEIT